MVLGYRWQRMNPKQQLLGLLRRARLLQATDTAMFRWTAFRARAARARFTAGHPGIPLPPDHLAYDAYGILHWDFYWGFGRIIAEFVAQRIRAQAAAGRVLEWGCGPARIIRHLPELLGPSWEVHGCDVSRATIGWCVAHLPAIRFSENGPAPPLRFPAGEFDCVYAVSVFTHLPADLQVRWAEDLHRVLKPGGLLICTLHGDASRPLLLPAEEAQYDLGRAVVRGTVTEGTRCYLAFHPAPFVVDHLLRGFEIIEHLPAPNVFGERQDVWVARARA